MTHVDIDNLSNENVLARPFKRLTYALRPERITLDDMEYCHIVDRRTGIAELVEGPISRSLSYDEVPGKIDNRITVPERHFCIVGNPFDGKIQHGKREVRVGPTTFALHPGELIEQPVREQYVLTAYDALLVQARTDFEGCKAGEKFLVTGPKTYIPSKDETVITTRKAIALSDTDGIYVQNQDTGDVTLVRGPADYFLQPNEQLYKKESTKDELAALGLVEQKSAHGVRVLTRQAANTSHLEDRTRALVLELEENEAVLLYDGVETRLEQGPKTAFLGPYERPKVLTLSGGKPIEPGALKVALLKLGPDFIYDQVTVRTNDNAQLRLDVTYKWRFNTDKDLRKAFSIDDFVGYAAESLSSEIRSITALHDFEEFHARSLEYVKEGIFKGKPSRIFEENSLEIFDIDITSITPQDPKIAEKLNEAIKSNMDIYCRKLVLKATLEAERQEVEGKSRIEKERAGLLEQQIANSRFKTIEDAKTTAESVRITAEGKAKATRIEAQAQRSAESERLGAVIAQLQRPGSKEYIDLQRAQAFTNSEKLVILPSDAKVVLPYVKDTE